MIRETIWGRMMLGLVTGLVACGGAQAADQGSEIRISTKALKQKSKPKTEIPFFFINDNRITYSWYRGALAGYTAKSSNNLATFTHFDAWAYGTNLVSLSYLAMDRSASTAPCLGPVLVPIGQCAGSTFGAASVRSTLGWNELFDTKAFSVGSLTGISFVASANAFAGNPLTASGGYDVTTGLQFAFALPYKGYFNVSPLFWKSWLYGADNFSRDIGGFLGAAPPFTGFPDGTQRFASSWGVDFNYDMPLGFLPESLQYFSISGRGSIRGDAGTGAYGSIIANPKKSTRVMAYTLEPVRLTLDAGKLFWGPQYAHLIDIWAAWKYDRNLGGHNEVVDTSCLTLGAYNGSCSNNTVYAGITMKLGQNVSGMPSGPVFGAPLFQSVDNRFGFGILPTATSPGQSASTFKRVFSISHEDIWSYGTNAIYGEYLKSDRTDPNSPCTALFNRSAFGEQAPCAGGAEINASLRSTLGFNEIFHTQAFRYGALRNVSFEVGGEFRTAQTYLAPAKKAVVAGLQFAFDLPYKGYLKVAPLYYQEWNHSILAYPNHAGNTLARFGLYGSPSYTGTTPPGFTGTVDGNLHYRPTWALEIGYGMDLGFLPENMQYLSISGRAGIYGPKGNGAYGGYTLPPGMNTATEINAEPIRLTFDVSKALWGSKYAHLIDAFVAYRYWKNKYGLDGGNVANRSCFFANGASNRSCTEQTVYTGVTAAF
ncbi:MULTISPECIES: hypothetical protein [unclassified Bradyrhizobium]|uniref:hypothetical protein n=1 Tax=unclassified Bradyrhizobium TaxID=2631580 RepID=UPI0028ED139C|nr:MULTISPECIES: hypothetical protein [unclassified Bradyrhizobium]